MLGILLGYLNESTIKQATTTLRPAVLNALGWTPMTGCEAVRQPCWTLVCQGQEHDIASLTVTKSRLWCRALALDLTTIPSLTFETLTTSSTSTYLYDDAQQVYILASYT
jgi:hypothetical protein